MQLIRAAHQPDAASRQPTETFTGTVHMDPICITLTQRPTCSPSRCHYRSHLVKADDCMGNNVCFSPGARTFWHTHERGQVLTVTLGSGLICPKGEQPRKLQVGDVVHIPAGETHWHGGGREHLYGAYGDFTGE